MTEDILKLMEDRRKTTGYMYSKIHNIIHIKHDAFHFQKKIPYTKNKSIKLSTVNRGNQDDSEYTNVLGRTSFIME